MATIVMTGGTSGFGEVALEQMIRLPGIRVILGARRQGPAGVETLSLDLSRLDKVQSFAAEVTGRLGATAIDALVLNAGLQMPNAGGRTVDGFETTFAVNHLAHYLLLRLLLPKLARQARIVLTTSGTYDPAEKTIIPPPRHADARLLAHPESDPNQDREPYIAGGRAYSASKLCIVLTARALAANPEIRNRQIKVIAYDPGPTPGTGLVRNSNFIVRSAWYVMGTPLLRPLITNINSRQSAGSALADLALGRVDLPEGTIYTALRKEKLTRPALSELAQRDDIMLSLWNDSAALVGLA